MLLFGASSNQPYCCKTQSTYHMIPKCKAYKDYKPTGCNMTYKTRSYLLQSEPQQPGGPKGPADNLKESKK